MSIPLGGPQHSDCLEHCFLLGVCSLSTSASMCDVCARLASFINGQDVLTILVNQSYGLPELKTDLQDSSCSGSRTSVEGAVVEVLC